MKNPKPVKGKPDDTLTISVPLELLINRITEATKPQLPALKKSLVDIDAARDIASASSAAAFKKPLEELKRKAVEGNPAALKELTSAGGPEKWIAAQTAMHPIHAASAERVARAAAPLWAKFSEDALVVVDAADEALFQEWKVAAEAMGVPVRKTFGQFDADRYPSEPLVLALRRSLTHLKNGNAKGNLAASLVLSRIFPAS